jgi:hypothetical protein
MTNQAPQFPNSVPLAEPGGCSNGERARRAHGTMLPVPASTFSLALIDFPCGPPKAAP